MATLHLIEGPVGAGKSTYAAKLALELSAPHLDLDEWMVVLFRPDRPDDGFMDWYAERKDRCIEQIWRVAQCVLDAGQDIVLELGLVQRVLREAVYARAELIDHELSVHVLDAPESIRWQRVQQRNEAADGTFKMVVPKEIFDVATGAWEAPDEDECVARNIKLVDTAN